MDPITETELVARLREHNWCSNLLRRQITHDQYLKLAAVIGNMLRTTRNARGLFLVLEQRVGVPPRVTHPGTDED